MKEAITAATFLSILGPAAAYASPQGNVSNIGFNYRSESTTIIAGQSQPIAIRSNGSLYYNFINGNYIVNYSRPVSKDAAQHYCTAWNGAKSTCVKHLQQTTNDMRILDAGNATIDSKPSPFDAELISTAVLPQLKFYQAIGNNKPWRTGSDWTEYEVFPYIVTVNKQHRVIRATSYYDTPQRAHVAAKISYENYSTISGTPIAMKTSTTSYNFKGDLETITRIEITPSSVSLNMATEAKLIEPLIPINCRVLNNITGRRYKQPAADCSTDLKQIENALGPK